MKRFSEKTFLKTGILEQLQKMKLVKDNKEFTFDYWYYEKGIYVFAFATEQEKQKHNHKALTIQLYWQHYNDYKNTMNLIKETFIKDNYKIMEGRK